MNIQEFKNLGDRTIKEYNAPIPEENFLVIGNWCLSYVTERTFFNDQKSLSISRLDGEDFDLKLFDIETPEVFEIFPRPRCVFWKTFKKRGLTAMCIL